MHADTSQPSHSPSAASLITSLNRSDSEGEIPLPLERPLLPQQPRRPAHSHISSLPFIILGGIIFLLVAATALLGSPAVGSTPTPRKSAGMVAFTNATGDDLLVVWSGMGHSEVLLADMLAFNIQARTWRKIHRRQRPPKSKSSTSIIAATAATQPEPRWKAAVSSIDSPSGMLVFGGDGMTKEGMVYLDDTWAFKFPDMLWEPLKPSQAAAETEIEVARMEEFIGGDDSTNNRVPPPPPPPPPSVRSKGPGPRRAHTAIAFTSVSEVESIVVFGGRRADGTLLNDVWLGEVQWPNITWKLLSAGYRANNDDSFVHIEEGYDTQDSLAPLAVQTNDSNTSNTKKKKFPCPRKGHTAVLREDPQKKGALEMVIYGGRNTLGYLGDLWVFNLKRGTWESIIPEDKSPLPSPRDHHAAELGTSGQMLVYGGRSGPTYEASQPMADLWAFDFGARRWSQIPEYGLRPLPRFLFSTARYQKQSQPLETLTAPQLFIFGGESLSGCKLNDVWALDLERLRWELMSPNVFAKKRCDRLFGRGGDGGQGDRANLRYQKIT